MPITICRPDFDAAMGWFRTVRAQDPAPPVLTPGNADGRAGSPHFSRAIAFALKEPQGDEFFSAWVRGDWQTIRQRWPAFQIRQEGDAHDPGQR